MQTLLFNRVDNTNDIFLIVDNVSLCKIDRIDIIVGGEIATYNPTFIKSDIIGTFTTFELDPINYQESMTSMIIINNKDNDHDYNIILFRIVISDINNNKVTTLQGNTKYSYTAKAMRVLDVGGKHE